MISDHERVVLRGLARGFTYEKIGQDEHMHPRTVRRHTDILRARFKATSLFSLAYEATRRGLID